MGKIFGVGNDDVAGVGIKLLSVVVGITGASINDVPDVATKV